MTIPSRIQNQKRIRIAPAEYPGYILLALWALTMIGLPVARWTLGDEILPAAIHIAAVLQAGAVFAFLRQEWGLTRTLQTLAIVAVLTWGAEVIGQGSGFPFGTYHYTDSLQPQIAGVPLLIPVAWFMLLPSAWTIAQLITGKRNTWQWELSFILMSAIALTAWDFFLDPQMVAWGFWVWDNPSGYFGIPWTNYAGWMLVAALVTIAVRPAELRPLPFALIYAIVWFLQTIGQGLFWGQVGPALVGCLAMGSLMAVAYWHSQGRST